MVTIILGNKGGIGKSTISAFLAEYIKKNSDKEMIGFDTDPENETFALYKEFQSKTLKLKGADNTINKNGFDEMIDDILSSKNKNIVIDIGASSFAAVNSYILENEIFELFDDEDINLLIVGIAAGAGNTVDSVNGLKTILETHSSRKFLVINNEYIGSTKYKGTEFRDTKVIKNNEDKILKIVDIESKPDYIQENINDFAQMRLTFNELDTSDQFTLMAKRRLKAYRDEIFEQLDILDDMI